MKFCQPKWGQFQISENWGLEVQILKLKKRPLMVIHVACPIVFLPLFLLSSISLPMLIPPSTNSGMITGEALAAFPSSLHHHPSLTQPLSFSILHGLSLSLSLSTLQSQERLPPFCAHRRVCAGGKWSKSVETLWREIVETILDDNPKTQRFFFNFKTKSNFYRTGYKSSDPIFTPIASSFPILTFFNCHWPSNQKMLQSNGLKNLKGTVPLKAQAGPNPAHICILHSLYLFIYSLLCYNSWYGTKVNNFKFKKIQKETINI